MDIEKLKAANKLNTQIEKMRILINEIVQQKDTMEFVAKDVQIHIRYSCGFTTWITDEDGGDFVIEKMIEAGYNAALTNLAAAENDLEKL